MRKLICAAALAGALSLAPVAQATVFYTLAGSFMADTDEDEVDELYEWSFSFSSADYLNSLQEVTPASCAITGTFYKCAATQTIDPTGSTWGPPIDDAYVGFNVANIDESGGGTAFYFFETGAFGADGLYSDAGHPDTDGGVGNAGPATLLVTSEATAVPEPMAWAMMISGFGLIGGALRTRRQTQLPAAADS